MPLLVNRASMTGTGQLPKFEDDMYAVQDDDLFLIPTAEVPITNLYRDEILDGGRTAARASPRYSACFRREAGAAGKDTRGLLRVHEFDKVELVRYATPETSRAELETLTRPRRDDAAASSGCRIACVLLAAGDTGFSSAKTYDLEVVRARRRASGSRCRRARCSPTSRRGAPTSAIGRRRARSRGSCTRSTGRRSRSRASSPRCSSTHQQPDGSVRVPEALQRYSGARHRWAERWRRRAPPFVLVALAVAAAAARGTCVYTQQCRRRAAARGAAAGAHVVADLQCARRHVEHRGHAHRRPARPGAAGAGVGRAAGAVTDPTGAVADTANLPFDRPLDRRRAAARTWPTLDRAERTRSNRPARAPSTCGDSRLVQGLAHHPAAAGRRHRAAAAARRSGDCASAGVRSARRSGPAWRASRRTSWARRSRRLAAGSSCSRIGRGRSGSRRARCRNMEQDLARLERVAHRFERIGRPPRRDAGGRSARWWIALAAYFAARVPTLARKVTDARRAPGGAARRRGRRRCCSNGCSKCSSRTPSMHSAVAAARSCCSVQPLAEGGARIRVQDDGPGVPRALRQQDLRGRLHHQGARVGHRAGARAPHRGGESRRLAHAAPTRTAARRSTLSCRHDIGLVRLALRSTRLDARGGSRAHARGAQSGPARGRAPRRRPAARARRRRLRQDARAHHAHRAADRRSAACRRGAILAVTFTNKAAGEMRERIARPLGEEPRGMWSGTFHASVRACCARIAPLVGRTPSFTIYDEDDSLSRRASA